MTESNTNNIQYVSYINDKGNDAAKDLKQFISFQGIKRSQIISITCNELEVQNTDTYLTMFYYEKPLNNDINSRGPVLYKHYDQNWFWNQLIAEGEKELISGTIALVHSAKNVGELRNQYHFYCESDMPFPKPTLKNIKRTDGDWDELVREVGEYLQHHIAPHDLKGVSLFEDSHPNNWGYINAVITHTAGSDPPILQDQGYEIEQMFVPDKFEWKNLFRDAQDYMNSKGDNWHHIVASANKTIEGAERYEDDAIVLVVSWNAMNSQGPKDMHTPSGTRRAGQIKLEGSSDPNCDCIACDIF